MDATSQIKNIARIYWQNSKQGIDSKWTSALATIWPYTTRVAFLY